MITRSNTPEPSVGAYFIIQDNDAAAALDQLSATLRTAAEQKHLVSIQKDAVRSLVSSNLVTPKLAAELLGYLVVQASEIKTQPDVMQNYADSIIALLKVFKPQEYPELVVALKNFGGSIDTVANLREMLSGKIIPNIQNQIFVVQSEHTAQTWFAAGRNITEALSYIDSMRGFDHVAAAALAHGEDLRRTETLSGNKTTFSEAVIDYLKPHLQAGETIEFEETEKYRTSFPDTVSYFGEISIKLCTGRSKQLVATIESSEAGSSTASARSVGLDRCEYTYRTTKTEALKWLPA